MIIDNSKDVEKFLEICENSKPIQSNSDSRILSKDEADAFAYSEKFIKRYQTVKIKPQQVYIDLYSFQTYYIVERVVKDFKTSEEFVIFKPVKVSFENERSYYVFDDKSSTQRYVLKVEDFIREFAQMRIDFCRIDCESDE